MVMDFKNLTFKNPQKAIIGVFIIFWLAILLLFGALWNRYATHNINVAKDQVVVINNYLLTISTEDTTALSKATAIFLKSEDTPIEDLFFSIYSESGNLLYTNSSSSRNNKLLSFQNIDDQIINSKTEISVSSIRYDTVLQKECIITASYESDNEHYIISECTINNDISLWGFFSSMSKKIILILILAIVANVCMFFLNKHISNIARLRKYILQLSEEDDIVKNDPITLTMENSVKGITTDLYTLYKKRIDILKQNDLEREKAIIDEKNRLYSKRTLANNLNHEIKTPIGIIIGYLDTMLNHPNIDKETLQSFLKKCLINTQRLQNMVVNIAMINRIEDGSNNIALEDINIYNIANLAKEDLKFTLEECNMTFQIDMPENILVRGNEMLLYNIFCNLIKNSCFYSGGSNITFKLKSQEAGAYVFTFSDNGKGVPEDSLLKLFTRFYRIDKDKNKKSGTGLGLPIVKESISLCGGHISATNADEGGLVFTFSLPMPQGSTNFIPNRSTSAQNLE